MSDDLDKKFECLSNQILDISKSQRTKQFQLLALEARVNEELEKLSLIIAEGNDNKCLIRFSAYNLSLTSKKIEVDGRLFFVFSDGRKAKEIASVPNIDALDYDGTLEKIISILSKKTEFISSIIILEGE